MINLNKIDTKVLVCIIAVLGLITQLISPWDKYFTNALEINNVSLPLMFKVLFFGVYDIMAVMSYNITKAIYLNPVTCSLLIVSIFGLIGMSIERLVIPDISTKIKSLISFIFIENITGYIASISTYIVIQFDLSKLFDSFESFKLSTILWLPIFGIVLIFGFYKSINIILYISVILTSAELQNPDTKVLNIINYILLICIMIALSFLCNILEDKIKDILYDKDKVDRILTLFCTACLMLLTSSYIDSTHYAIANIEYTKNQNIDIKVYNLDKSKSKLDGFRPLDVVITNNTDDYINIKQCIIEPMCNNLYISEIEETTDSNIIGPACTKEYFLYCTPKLNYAVYIMLFLILSIEVPICLILHKALPVITGIVLLVFISLSFLGGLHSMFSIEQESVYHRNGIYVIFGNQEKSTSVLLVYFATESLNKDEISKDTIVNSWSTEEMRADYVASCLNTNSNTTEAIDTIQKTFHKEFEAQLSTIFEYSNYAFVYFLLYLPNIIGGLIWYNIIKFFKR